MSKFHFPFSRAARQTLSCGKKSDKSTDLKMNSDKIQLFILDPGASFDLHNNVKKMQTQDLI
jgi:hypothetical protein